MSKMGDGIHTFYDIKTNDGEPVEVRQLQKNDSYNICTKNEDSDSYCKVVGRGSQGRVVSRKYFNGIHDTQAYYDGTNIGDTGIILTTDNDQVAIDILSSMEPYKD